MPRSTPTLELELDLLATGRAARIAGLDEAGRGALAGPVVAAAVILPVADEAKLAALHAVNDSKQLTSRQRDVLFDLIVANALAYAVGAASAQLVDKQGVIQATKIAMRAALTRLKPAADYLLIDGRLRLKDVPTPQQALIRGDGRSLSIAAASILAKVSRDRLMIALHDRHPVYGFAQNKGYGTPFHLAALAQHGPTASHRHSFAPIAPRLVD